jgi:hypothetical protein
MSQVIPVVQGGNAALAFVMRILTQQFNADLVSELGLITVVIDGQSLLFTPDGVFMPPVARWFRQAAPTRKQIESPPHSVTGFVGPVGATQYPNPFRSLTGWGSIGDTQLPFGVTLMIKAAPQAAVADPVQPTHYLTPRELILMRCLHYQGVLKHTLTKWGCRDVACRDINPTEDIAVGGDLDDYTEDEANTARGVIYVEFTIYQEQGFPTQSALPAP